MANLAIDQGTTTQGVAAFNGGPYQSYWWNDEHLSPHLTMRANMAHRIDSVALDSAWEKTLRVYPLLGLVPRVVDEEVLFFEGAGGVAPLRSRSQVAPGTEAVGGRGVSLTYWGSTLVLSAYHSLTDARGLAEVFKTLLCLYAEASTGVVAEPACSTLEEGRAPERYFVQSTMLSPRDYTPLPLTLCRSLGDVFCDERVGEDSDDGVTVAQISVPFDPLASLCAALGTSMDVLLLYVLARGVYAANPGEPRDLCMAVACDFREAFHVPASIAPCSRPMPLVVGSEQVVGRPLGEALAAVAAMRARQTSRDYVCSHLALENTYGLLNLRRACITVNCACDFDIGEAASLLKGIELFDCSLRSAWLIRLGDALLANLQFGRETARYADAFVAVLQELGMDARVSVTPYVAPVESAFPVTEPEE